MVWTFTRPIFTKLGVKAAREPQKNREILGGNPTGVRVWLRLVRLGGKQLTSHSPCHCNNFTGLLLRGYTSLILDSR